MHALTRCSQHCDELETFLPPRSAKTKTNEKQKNGDRLVAILQMPQRTQRRCLSRR